MSERVLAEGRGRIALVGEDGCLILSFTDGATMDFPVEADVLLGVLENVPVQLSQSDGHCRLEAISGRVRIEFALERGGRGACAIEADVFREALGQFSTG